MVEPRRSRRTSRRTFLTGLGVSVAAVVGLTAGQTFAPLSGLNLFGPRVRGFGPQGLPVNRTAEQAKVTELAMDPAWKLTMVNGDRSSSFSLAELRALPQTEVVLPIACVEGWSTSATWRGVRLRELLSTVDAASDAELVVRSLQPKGGYRVTSMGPEFATDDMTLVALELNGEPLHIDHGFPARMIAPARPGVLQTKWLSSVEVA